MAIFIPVHEAATTHCTANLSGFPAVDFMGSLGEDVFIDEDVKLYNPHMIDWRQGYGGWTFYMAGKSGEVYFVTHLDETLPAHEGEYANGARIGRLTLSAAHAALINGAHVHVGNTGWPSPPGQNCGVPPSGVPTSTGGAGSVRVSHEPAKRGVIIRPGSATTDDTHLTRGWHVFAQKAMETVGNRSGAADRASRQYKAVVTRPLQRH